MVSNQLNPNPAKEYHYLAEISLGWATEEGPNPADFSRQTQKKISVRNLSIFKDELNFGTTP